MKKGSIVRNIEDNLPLRYVVQSGPDHDGDYKVINTVTGYQTYIPAYLIEKVKGEKPFATASVKANGYVFTAMQRGKQKFFTAGCRLFTSRKEYRQHWSNGKNGFHYSTDPWHFTDDRKAANVENLAAMKKADEKLQEKLS